MTNPISKAVNKTFEKVLDYVVGKNPKANGKARPKVVHVGDFFVKEPNGKTKEVSLLYRSSR